MGKAELKNMSAADEIRRFEKGQLELVKIGGTTVGRFTLQPGWRWSEHVKPSAGTELCQMTHFNYQVSGTLHVKMADGTEIESKGGDVTTFPPGHDAWVVGNEPAVLIDWAGTNGVGPGA
jgi:quercetin dioxygenase-like cupin family protein